MDRLQCSVGDYVCHDPPVRARPTDTVLEVLAALHRDKSHFAVVSANGGVDGIFTERDLVVRVLARGWLPAEVAVSEVMTRDVEVLEHEDDVAYAINRMAEGGFRNIPVVDGQGRLCGAVNIAEVTSQLAQMLVEDTADDGLEDEWVDIGGGG